MSTVSRMILNNRDNRVRWIEALESGKYIQIANRLRDAGIGFCCLGVACEISELGKWEGSIYIVKTEEQPSSGSYLSPSILDYLQMTDDEREYAVQMNDAGHCSFKEIAAFFRGRWDIRKYNWEV